MANNNANNPADNAGGTGNENQGKTFTQEQLDAIIGERLAKEKAKYADYEDIKAKATKFDELEEANKTELQKAQDQAATYKAELEKMKSAESIRTLRAKISKDTGVPADLLTADTEEACKAQADAIKAFAGNKKYPNVKNGGESNPPSTTTKAEILAIKDEKARLKAIRENIELFN